MAHRIEIWAMKHITETFIDTPFADIQLALTHFDEITATSTKHYVIAEGINGKFYIMLKEDAEGLKNIAVDRSTFTNSAAAEEERAYLESTYDKQYAVRYDKKGHYYVTRY